MTENEHKNMSGNIPEMLVLKWNWRKAKNCGSLALNAKNSSHHNVVKDKAILKGAKASSSFTNAMILPSFSSKS